MRFNCANFSLILLFVIVRTGESESYNFTSSGSCPSGFYKNFTQSESSVFTTTVTGPFPVSITSSPDGSTLFFGTRGSHHNIYEYVYSSNIVSILAGSNSAGSFDGVGENAAFNMPNGMAITEDGSSLYIADTDNHAIRLIELSSRQVVTFVGTLGDSGDVLGHRQLEAKLNSPHDVKLSPDGGILYIADTGNYRIRRLDLETDIVSTLVGSSALGHVDSVSPSSVKFNYPTGITVSSDGKSMFIADQVNNCIRRVEGLDSPLSVVTTTLAGQGQEHSGMSDGAIALFNKPSKVEITNDGEVLFVSDTESNRIAAIIISSRETLTIAGCSGIFSVTYTRTHTNEQ